MSIAQHVWDANILIRLNRDYIPPDIWASYWDVLQQIYCEGKWLLLQVVHEELMNGNDSLKEWIKQPCFQPIPVDDPDTVLAYSGILTTLRRENRYKEPALRLYADSADSWIVAYAKAHNAVIVTLEKPEPGRTAKVKIPDVATANNVLCIDQNQYFRNPGISVKF